MRMMKEGKRMILRWKKIIKNGLRKGIMIVEREGEIGMEFKVVGIGMRFWKIGMRRMKRIILKEKKKIKGI